jgi:rhodanese-related sulfurtransferase
MSQWQVISVAEAERMIADTHVLVLDMRDFRSYQASHYPKALHLNDINLRGLLKHTARHVPIVIYCYHGHSSQDMAKLFADFGFTSCYSLDGGYEKWFQAINLPSHKLTATLATWMQARGFDSSNLDRRGWNNETALMCAAREGASAVCAELIRAGASVNMKNKDGNNALWIACVSEAEDIIQLLLNHAVDIDNQNDNGATALIYAASKGKTRLVKMLVDAGADTHLSTVDDFTALAAAANVEILKFLRTYTAPLAQAS